MKYEFPEGDEAHNRQKTQIQKLVSAEKKQDKLKMNDRDGMLSSLQPIKCIQNDANVSVVFLFCFWN